MEKDRDQIVRLLYLIAPVMMLFVTFSSLFCYELGKHGLSGINWGWILQSEFPVLIVSISLLLQARKKHIKQNVQ